ncbi:MAG: ABC transporter substrate-binding protein [Burkholderiales bacterium]|nr:ABC transporter substrate-binding protein [Burkholderiales bacterium]
MNFKKTALIVLCSLYSLSAYASRTVEDQLGRTVTIPDQVNRAVVLQHQTLNIANQLDANSQIVGVLKSWKKQLGQDYVRLDPALEKMATPGDLTSVNMEELLKVKPDVVFVTNYAPKEMIQQIADAGIPVIGISLRVGPKGEASKLNPTLKDDAKAYTEGLRQGIELIAYVFNKQENGKELINATFAHSKYLEDKISKIKESERPRVYVANPDLVTYGSGKFTGVFLEAGGAYNVAAKTIKGYKQVSMEDVLKWNPEMILIQNRYPQVGSQIKNGAEWQNVKAVKDDKVFLMPQYAKTWGYPQPEAIGIGELWLAKTLYPEQFKDLDLDKLVQGWYKKFYRTDYIPDNPLVDQK